MNRPNRCFASILLTFAALPLACLAQDDAPLPAGVKAVWRSEEHTSELQSLTNLVCRLLLEKKTFPGALPARAAVRKPMTSEQLSALFASRSRIVSHPESRSSARKRRSS